MMIKSYPGIADAADYARFCDVNSFDPDSPFIRQYYKKSMARQIKHEQRFSSRRGAGASRPVYAIGLTAAIELAVSHLSDNHPVPERHRCVACNIEFTGARQCPRCGNHVYCVGVDDES
ncbi:hypothetical protein HBD75_003479 [Salmonella enterica]|nr:hypothetical protein [Salmonella enterica]EEU4805588.1 hypothetical protein [Salmonella enterica]EEU4869123.1 hypothetical protein [Salmonella enterica]EEU4896455.1 hypothetical protein [Salmonella enterica]